MNDQGHLLPNSLPAALKNHPTVVAIGNFDGVHKGHQAVLREVLQEARRRKLIPVALTFHPHPTRAVGRPSPACLTPIWRKIRLIERLDPTIAVVVVHFDETFSTISPERFIADVLVSQLNAKAVRVGDNFRFGARRAGNLATLVEAGKRFGFDAKAAPTAQDHIGRLSSTRIRAAISSGDLNSARHMLGRPHSLSGTVLAGQQRARTLGFPTANIRWIEEALPPRGVYAVAVERVREDRSAERLGVGVCNIGVRPTVDAGFAVEAHIFDFSGDLYDQHIRIHLLKALRPERKFADLMTLERQIRLDIIEARSIVSKLEPAPDAASGWF